MDTRYIKVHNHCSFRRCYSRLMKGGGVAAEAKEVEANHSSPGTWVCNKRTHTTSVITFKKSPLPGLVIVTRPLLPVEGGDPGAESVVVRVLLVLDSPPSWPLSPAPCVVRPTRRVLFAHVWQLPAPVRARPVPIQRPVLPGQSVMAVISPDDEIIMKRWTMIRVLRMHSPDSRLVLTVIVLNHFLMIRTERIPREKASTDPHPLRHVDGGNLVTSHFEVLRLKWNWNTIFINVSFVLLSACLRDIEHLAMTF